MSWPERPVIIDGVRYRSKSAACEALGVYQHRLAKIIRADKSADFNLNCVDPRSGTENAVTAAFRAVFGWCPVRDGISSEGMPPQPKSLVSLSDDLWPLSMPRVSA